MEEKTSLYDMLKKTNGSYMAFRDILSRKTTKSGALLTALLELTPVCNLNCAVCYIRRTNEEVIASGNHVMRFDEWKYYIDGLCEMGVYNMTLSGGECTAHPDFEEIYKYCYDKKLDMSIITNGSCLNDKLFELFKNRPPSRIFITLYGMSEETYEKFCKNGAAFNKVMSNIDTLLQMKMHVVLQYTSGKDNIHDFEKAYDYAASKGCLFAYNGDLINHGTCDANKIEATQPDEELFYAAVKNITMKQYKMTAEQYDKKSNQLIVPIYSKPPEDKGIPCNAGRNSCTISWQGKMQACVAFDALMLDPHENGGIEECWEKVKDFVRNVPALKECQQCIFKSKCKLCYAMHYGDTKELGKISPRLCYKVKYPEEAAKRLAEYEKSKENE